MMDSAKVCNWQVNTSSWLLVDLVWLWLVAKVTQDTSTTNYFCRLMPHSKVLFFWIQYSSLDAKASGPPTTTSNGKKRISEAECPGCEKCWATALSLKLFTSDLWALKRVAPSPEVFPVYCSDPGFAMAEFLHLLHHKSYITFLVVQVITLVIGKLSPVALAVCVVDGVE